jgi:hypothetical protein
MFSNEHSADTTFRYVESFDDFAETAIIVVSSSSEWLTTFSLSTQRPKGTQISTVGYVALNGEGGSQ